MMLNKYRRLQMQIVIDIHEYMNTRISPHELGGWILEVDRVIDDKPYTDAIYIDSQCTIMIDGDGVNITHP